MSQQQLFPKVTFNSLPHADGSATYSWRGYTIACAVNGPIEPQRRDELPEEAFLEVNVRPISGPGGPRDRHTETLLHSTLSSLILTAQHPRSLIQISLQILHTPSAAASVAPPAQTDPILPALPHLLHAAVLALLHANTPLRTTAVGVCVGLTGPAEHNSDMDVDNENQDDDDDEASSIEVRLYPESQEEGTDLKSSHVFAFTGSGKCILTVSQGSCTVAQWSRAAEFAQRLCHGRKEGDRSLQTWLKSAVEEHVKSSTKWREH